MFLQFGFLQHGRGAGGASILIGLLCHEATALKVRSARSAGSAILVEGYFLEAGHRPLAGGLAHGDGEPATWTLRGRALLSAPSWALVFESKQ